MSASIILSLAFSLCLSLAEGGNGGFGIKLIHRDSPSSPFYNPSDTIYDRVSKAAARSTNRLNHFHSMIMPNTDPDYFRSQSMSSFSPASSPNASPSTIESKVIPSGGSFLMKLAFGTPPVELVAIADTGSDLTWAQCKPCTQCYKQKDPLFDPRKSSTYRNIACNSRLCEALADKQRSCSTSERVCEYSYGYGDGSHTIGVVAAETLTFESTSGGTVKIPKIAIGCGHDNAGTFDENNDGLVGLGGGPLSLVSQLGSSIDGKFSYCLVPLDKTSASSIMHFGDSSAVSGKGVLSTPLYSGSQETFYYLKLEYIEVGNKQVEISPLDVADGNIIIDSGTTLTILQNQDFENLAGAVSQAVNAEPVSDPTQTFQLCFDSNVELPDMTFAFTRAKVTLPPSNTFISPAEGVICLAMVASNGPLAIYGNVAQQNFKVGYDLVGKKVSFKPTDCTNA